MKRVLTALVLAPVIVWVVVAGPQLVFLAVLAAVALLCFHEYSGIIAAYGIEKPGPFGFAAGIVLLLMPLDTMLLATLIALLALTLAMASGELARGLPRAAALFLGIFYVFGTLRWAAPLRDLSPYWLLFALALTWIGDIAAYYTGRLLGRHRLAPAISPGKTWEGAAGSLMGALLFAFFFVPRFLPAVPLGAGMALAAAGNMAGQAGDLAESALKRGAGVKDSGSMLPGHGGWLDRVDSTLFVVPVIYWLATQVLALASRP